VTDWKKVDNFWHQLANKERQLQHFSKIIAPQEELTASNEKLKQELEDAKKEISRLRALLEAKDGERNKEKTPTPPPVSDNYLIISLQHQVSSLKNFFFFVTDFAAIKARVFVYASFFPQWSNVL